MLQVKVTKMNDLKFEKNLFNPLKTGRAIDSYFSSEGGVMPGTNTVVTGDPGVGKTTVLLDILADMNNKGKKVLFVSGEMIRLIWLVTLSVSPSLVMCRFCFSDTDDEDPLEVLRGAFMLV